MFSVASHSMPVMCECRFCCYVFPNEKCSMLAHSDSVVFFRSFSVYVMVSRRRRAHFNVGRSGFLFTLILIFFSLSLNLSLSLSVSLSLSIGVFVSLYILAILDISRPRQDINFILWNMHLTRFYSVFD